MVFENGVKNIQAAAYNGARTVYIYIKTEGVKFLIKQENSIQYNGWTVKVTTSENPDGGFLKE